MMIKHTFQERAGAFAREEETEFFQCHPRSVAIAEQGAEIGLQHRSTEA